MKKGYGIGLLLSFLICYLEWGHQRAFIFQMEYEFFVSTITLSSLLHPFILLPFIGQLLLLYPLFLKDPNPKLILTGMILLGLLAWFIFIISIISLNPEMIACSLPFTLTSILFIRHYKTLNRAYKEKKG
jgi:hypothetical protein